MENMESTNRGLGWELVESSCEYDNEHFGSLKCEFLLTSWGNIFIHEGL
jgi:hypothetical protein